MKNQTGYTLIELMVVLAIVGILFTTAMPFYSTLRQRAIGTEVKITAQNIMDAQLAYFLEHNKFYHPKDTPIYILHDTSPDDTDLKDIANNLHITIAVGHRLNYSLRATNETNNESFILIISSEGGFEFFKGVIAIAYEINKAGVITIWTL